MTTMNILCLFGFLGCLDGILYILFGDKLKEKIRQLKEENEDNWF